jgi:outer membrane immunogenic protein
MATASAFALAMAAHPTLAADIPTKAPIYSAPVAAPLFNWTGFYVGVQGGYGWGDSRFNDGVSSNWFDIDGWFAGATIGYNFQLTPNWVAGVEADLSSGISGSFGPGNLGQPNGAGWGCGSGPCVTDIKWFGTLRGRLGYAVNNWLLYGTGGFAWGKLKSEIENTTDFVVSDTNSGWTAGVGLEYAVSPVWTAKVEYLHVDLGWTKTQGFFKSDTRFDLVRVGINYRFATGKAPGPVMTRY